MNDARVLNDDTFRESDYELYDGIYEEYVETIGKSEKSDKVNEIVFEKNAKITDDILYEEYENAYEEYTPRYASYSSDEKSKIQVILKKLGKKEKFILSIILFFFIVALSLGVYFGLQNSEEIMTDNPVNTTDIHTTETSKTNSEEIMTDNPVNTTDIHTTETNKTNSCLVTMDTTTTNSEYILREWSKYERSVQIKITKQLWE